MKHDHISTAVFAVLVALAIALQPACAQSSGPVRGQVIEVDRSAGEITIRHGPMKKLGMDRGMTMVFRMQEPAKFKKIKAGDRVRFEALDVNNDYSVTRIEKVR
jgi:Cu(I)/Ag(I) efflux system periplasmic protein CusF